MYLMKSKNMDLNRKFIVFDDWYAGLRTSKLSGKSMAFLTRLTSNFLVNPDNAKKYAGLNSLNIFHEKIMVQWKYMDLWKYLEYFKELKYAILDHIVLDRDESRSKDLVNKSWKIYEYHGGIEQS